MYCIAKFDKVKERQKFSAMASHNFRIHLTQIEAKRIDSTRSHLNRILINPLGIDSKNSGDMGRKIFSFYEKNQIAVRDDSVLAVDLVLTTSPEFFRDAEGKAWHAGGKIRPEFQKKIDEWVATQIDFVKKQFGESAIKMAVLHLDETTPHIHFVVTPEETKELKYKNQFGEHKKVATSLNAKRWNPSFWKKFLTNYEKSNKKFGLRKGEEGSMAENVDLKAFGKLVSDATNQDYSKAIEKMIDGLKDDLSGFHTKDGAKKILLEKLLPQLNPLLKSNRALKKVVGLDRAKEYEAIKQMKAKLEKVELELAKLVKDNQARKDVYTEAINSKGVDVNLILAYKDKVAEQAEELARLRAKYEPETTHKNKKGAKNGFSLQ
ncbi:MobV family relaxase [Burkholderia vietnamiensis]|uniref:MobV family relaxase n=1 Tax=Burkholderia vietnamiensis TaxID=60552 RepID=UPI001592D59B|nr:MobV family relaxase [Burkholderia vietnamiensis]MBR8160038.1 plasmid recombination protein [Burkholderia vietnamiensis]